MRLDDPRDDRQAQPATTRPAIEHLDRSRQRARRFAPGRYSKKCGCAGITGASGGTGSAWDETITFPAESSTENS
jgi:hypothetical protein